MTYGHQGWRKVWIDGDEPGVMWVPVNPMLMPGEVEISFEEPSPAALRLATESERIDAAVIEDLSTAYVSSVPLLDDE